MLRSHEDAKDVTQDVLIRFWRNADGVAAERALPWLMRVTRNACIDAIRHRRTVRTVVECGADPNGVPARDASRDRPDAGLEAADDRSVVESALEEMPEPYRSIVILREIQGMKYEEISGAMDMPLNTVKVYLHRGRKKLRDALENEVNRERVA